MRPDYTDLPAFLRTWVEGVLGSPVAASTSAAHGFSPGVAARLLCRDGSRAFLKAVSSQANPDTPALHRAEARVTPLLPRHLRTARLLASYDEAPWVALLLEDLAGRPPEVPWRQRELDAALVAVVEVGRTPAPARLPAAADVLAGAFGGWARFEPSGTGWQDRHLTGLRRLEADWVVAGTGDRWQHGDVRADNLIVRPDGGVVLVDWPSAFAGHPLWDLVMMAPSVVVDGGPVPEALLARAGVDVDVDVLLVMVAAAAGYWQHRRQLPPPPGLPGVRAFQARQGDVAVAWLRRLTGWR